QAARAQSVERLDTVVQSPDAVPMRASQLGAQQIAQRLLPRNKPLPLLDRSRPVNVHGRATSFDLPIDRAQLRLALLGQRFLQRDVLPQLVDPLTEAQAGPDLLG